MSHGPIEKKHLESMGVMADALCKVFKGYGFCLLVFDLNSHEGRMNYISNAERKDMLVALKEFIAANEAGVYPPPKAKQ